jgi:hypothetical protein
MPPQPSVLRSLVGYERDPVDALVGEWGLRGISLAELQALFGAAADDPMYGSWPVRPEHVERLARAVDHEIDLTTFDYFVEATAE